MANLNEFKAAYVNAAQRVINGARTVKPFASTLEARNRLRGALSDLDEILGIVDAVNKVLEGVSLPPEEVSEDKLEDESEDESEDLDGSLEDYLVADEEQ